VSDRPIETGRWYRMEMNVEKTKVMRISGQPSPAQHMVFKTQVYSVEYYNYWGSVITDGARCTHEISSRIAIAKQHSTTRRLFSQANCK
jgi:hypothetical protein